jgi:hypothetical protein
MKPVRLTTDKFIEVFSNAVDCLLNLSNDKDYYILTVRDGGEHKVYVSPNILALGDLEFNGFISAIGFLVQAKRKTPAPAVVTPQERSCSNGGGRA